MSSFQMSNIDQQFRTFTTPQISQFLKDRVSASGLDVDSFELDPARHPIQLNTLAPDLVHIEAFFTFKTKIGNGDGVLRLVPSQNQWKCWTFFTVNLIYLINHLF
jgi:hypothetical protein